MGNPSSLSVAAASQRLPNRPGQPRKAPPRHNAGRLQAGAGLNDGPDGRALAQQSSVSPRLLTMRQAAEYLAVSYWTVRGWVESGKLSPVRLGERLIRIERADLDRLVETRKESV